MRQNIDSKGREWITKQTRYGKSYQATQINGKWYIDGGYCFGNVQDARMTYPNPENLIDVHPCESYLETGLQNIYVLVPLR